MQKLLSKDDFNLMDIIHTKDGRTLTVGLINNDDFITSANAYLAYIQGMIVSKTKWTKMKKIKWTVFELLTKVQQINTFTEVTDNKTKKDRLKSIKRTLIYLLMASTGEKPILLCPSNT